MPVGLIIMQWNDRYGAQVKIKYPDELNVSEETLMQVYATHEYSREAGMISLLVGSLNIASFYTGPQQSLYLILFLMLDEDPDDYEGGLTDASRVILQNLEDDEYLKIIPSLFQRISTYPTMNEEQKLAFVYQDEVNRLILNRLQDEGVFTKSELKIWLEDVFRGWFVDIDSVVIELIKKGIIKESTIKGVTSELLFLINDLVIMRTPPLLLLRETLERNLPEKLIDDYKIEVKNYFKLYKPTLEDNLILADLLTDPEIYQILRLLRMYFVRRSELEKLRKKGVDDIDGALKKLWSHKIIHTFQDETGVEYYALICDIHVSLMYPKYILNKITHQYDVKSKNSEILLEYLNVLQEAYSDMKKSSKIKQNTN